MKNRNIPTNHNIHESYDESQAFITVQSENLEQLERKVEAERTSSWFKTFVENTNEKKIINSVVQNFFEKLRNETISIKPNILDIGCGDGTLSLAVSESLKGHYPNLTYFAIDYDPNFAHLTRNKLDDNHIPNYVIQGNCFSDDLNKLPNGMGLIIASNVAYYTQDIPGFVGKVMSKLDDYGISIFIHESPTADLNILRHKYGARVETSATENIATSLKNNNNLYEVINIESKLRFPDNMNELWEELGKSNYYDTSNTKLPNFDKAKNLLEFVIQRPLESLQAQGLLKKYFSEVRELLDNQDNNLIVRSAMQVSAHSFALGHYQKLSSIVEQVNKEFIPDTKNIKFLSATLGESYQLFVSMGL